MVLNDGTYWFIYSLLGSPDLPAGFVSGSSATTGNAFTSDDGIDYNFDGTAGTGDFSISGTFSGLRNFGGAFTYGPGSVASFVTAYVTNYDRVPSLATLAGSYSGNGALGTRTSAAVLAPQSYTTTFAIDASGVITGEFVITSSGLACPFTGSAERSSTAIRKRRSPSVT